MSENPSGSEEEETVVIMGGLRSQLNALEALLPSVKESGTHQAIRAHLLNGKACVESAITTAQNE